MKHKIALVAALAAVLTTGSSYAADPILIIGDDYNVPQNGSGYALNTGVNAGINPPTATRLTGIAAPGLRYYQYSGAKLATHQTVTNNEFVVFRTGDPSVVTFTPGSGAADFSVPLRAASATPSLPSVYEIRFKMGNPTQPGIQRSSFGITTDVGGVAAWDFGIQLTRPAGADYYEVHRRIDADSNPTASDLDHVITNTAAGTYGTLLTFLIKVTDAGPETSGTFNSRVQVSLDDGATWCYDTQTDEFLSGGSWSLNTTGRYFFWDIAGFGRLNFDDFTVTWISGPAADTTQVWTGGAGDTSWSSGANWQSGQTPQSGDKLVFTGTAKQSNMNDMSGLLVPWIAFDNGGFELLGSELTMSSAFTNAAGNNVISLPTKWATSSAKWWHIAAGSQLTINNSASIDVIGNHTLLGGGTLRLASLLNIGSQNPAIVINEGSFLVDGPSANFTSVSGIRIGSSPATTTFAEAIVTNAAQVNLTTSNNGEVRVGDSANGLVNRLIIDNSTFTMTGADMGIPWVAGSIGEVLQTGGTVTGGDIVFNRNGAGTGTYTVKNGVLAPREISKNVAGGNSSISFDNATLQTPSGAKWNFLSGLDVAEIRAGGLILDVNQDSVRPDNAPTNQVLISAALSGAGGVTKIGGNTALLTGTNTYAGPTAVQQGKLVLTTVQSHPGSIQVNSGAELGVLLAEGGGTLTSGSLTLASGSTLSFDLAANDAVAAPLMQASSVSASGPITVNISAQSGQLSTGSITLLQYSGSLGGGGSFVLGNTSGLAGQLVHNAGSLQFVIQSVEKFTWEGNAGTSWDTGSANWFSPVTGTGSFYKDGFLTEFNDSATTGTVDIQTSVGPSSIVVNNTNLPYVFSSGGIITPLLTKTGPSSLTRVLGSTTDSIGEIQINEGSLILETTADKDFGSVLSGASTLVKSGTSQLTVTSQSPLFDGNIQILSGIYKFGINSSLGSTNGSTTISAGATLDLNNFNAVHEPVFVSGDGVNGQGAIINSSDAGGVQNNLTDVTLLGHTTFSSASRWDLRIRSGTGAGSGLKGNGYNLTKVGSGSTSIAAQRHNYGTNIEGTPVSIPYWEMNLGDIFINEGALTFAESLSLGNPAKTITIAWGAILSTFDLGVTNPITRNIFVTDGHIQSGGSNSGGDTNVWTGTINATGHLHLRVNSNSRMFINGPIVGTGSVGTSDQNGRGFLALNGLNTFSGGLYVTNGTLVGGGSISGNLVMLGGTNSPGMSPADLRNGVGNFTVGGDATLAGTTRMELAPGQTPNSDKLTVNGAFTWGGNLEVVLAPGAALPGSGDTFQLFNKVGTGSFSTSLPPLRAGLSWNDRIAIDGTLSVTGTVADPIITDAHLEGTNIVVSGTGGVDGMNYNMLSSTNVAAPLNQWQSAGTAPFGTGGTFSFTNSATSEKMFYRVLIP